MAEWIHTNLHPLWIVGNSLNHLLPVTTNLLNCGSWDLHVVTHHPSKRCLVHGVRRHLNGEPWICRELNVSDSSRWSVAHRRTTWSVVHTNNPCIGIQVRRDIKSKPNLADRIAVTVLKRSHDLVHLTCVQGLPHMLLRYSRKELTDRASAIELSNLSDVLVGGNLSVLQVCCCLTNHILSYRDGGVLHVSDRGLLPSDRLSLFRGHLLLRSWLLSERVEC